MCPFMHSFIQGFGVPRSSHKPIYICFIICAVQEILRNGHKWEKTVFKIYPANSINTRVKLVLWVTKTN